MIHSEAPRRVVNAQARFTHAINSRPPGRESLFADQAGYGGGGWREFPADFLDRVQIVKGWSKSGQSFEKIYDVVWAGDRKPDYITGKVPPIGSTVDVQSATYKNTIGKSELKTVWTDPDFDPALDAFYYARVLEIPTPRWTTIQAKELGILPPESVPATVEERAWSSPIWFTPTATSPTVAALKKQGMKPLDDATLTKLVVGKIIWRKNTVTRSMFRIVWDKDGQRTFWNINPSDDQPQHFGFAAQDPTRAFRPLMQSEAPTSSRSSAMCRCPGRLTSQGTIGQSGQVTALANPRIRYRSTARDPAGPDRNGKRREQGSKAVPSEAVVQRPTSCT